MKKEVLIVGAGLSGLTVAFGLEKAGIPYTILEARDRLGGRIMTHRTSSGNTIELGATWFSDKHRHLIQLLRELNVPYQNQYAGEKVLYDYYNNGRKVEEISIPPGQESTYIFSNGSEDLIHTLYSSLNADKVLFSEELKSLTYANGSWQVITEGKSFDVGIVVCTVPPNLFSHTIALKPKLPEEVMDVCKTTHTWMGESLKVGGEFSFDAWRPRGVGSFYSQFGPAVEFYDHQHLKSNTPGLMGFMDTNRCGPDLESRKKQFADQLGLYFEKKPELMEYVEMDWRTQPFTYHPYAHPVAPHQNNGHALLRKPMFDGRLFFAGSETARHFPGYMDGAVERGLEVSGELIAIQTQFQKT